jgi:ABC-type Co2+ transport system permease subunit
MHIEPGYVASAKILAANLAAAALLGSQSIHLLKAPQLVVRSLIAGVLFLLFMQAFHLPVRGLGFVPALFGFAIGLLAQGLLFAPADLVHIGVNTLSLAVPLTLVHATLGKRLLAARARLDLRAVLKLDAAVYSGVTLMVGFWLAVGEVATPLSAWLAFASSYAAIVAVEPLLTLLVVAAIARGQHHAAVRFCFQPQAV